MLPIGYCTVFVTEAVVRPNSFVAVCDGVTTTLAQRMAPICGVTSTYDAPGCAVE